MIDCLDQGASFCGTSPPEMYLSTPRTFPFAAYPVAEPISCWSGGELRPKCGLWSPNPTYRAGWPISRFWEVRATSQLPAPTAPLRIGSLGMSSCSCLLSGHLPFPAPGRVVLLRHRLNVIVEGFRHGITDAHDE